MNLPTSKTYAWWLALLRITAGAMWLGHGIPKFVQSDAFMPPNGMMGTVVAKAVQNSSGFYHAFLLNSVQPNLALFAELVRLGEVLVGCSLVLGVCSRLGGVGGAFLALNYVAAGGIGTIDGWEGVGGAMFALSIVNLVLPTGRVLGVDALLGRRGSSAPRVVIQPSAPGVHAEFVEERPLEGPTAPKT